MRDGELTETCEVVIYDSDGDAHADWEDESDDEVETEEEYDPVVPHWEPPPILAPPNLLTPQQDEERRAGAQFVVIFVFSRRQ